MSEFKNAVHMIDQKPGKADNMRELTEIIDTLMTELKKAHPAMYEKTLHEVYALAYHIHKEQAEAIVKAMKPHGQKWTYEQVKEYVSGKGITEEPCKWYMAMNMAYNDYYKTAEYAGKQDDAEFYFCIARDFITDKDARAFKVERYFLGE